MYLKENSRILVLVLGEKSTLNLAICRFDELENLSSLRGLNLELFFLHLKDLKNLKLKPEDFPRPVDTVIFFGKELLEDVILRCTLATFTGSSVFVLGGY